MFYANTFTLKMENKKMAAKALEVMREALAQIDADGFKYVARIGLCHAFASILAESSSKL